MAYELLIAVQGYFMKANHAQMCKNLCESYNGILTFENGRCVCDVFEDNELSLSYVQRSKRNVETQTQDGLPFDQVTSNDETFAERAARCCLKGTRRSSKTGTKTINLKKKHRSIKTN